MNIKLDWTDKQIIDLLTIDGRMPASDIARTIGGITERAVRYRIQRLVDEGVISITAVVNPKAIGFPVIADIFIQVEPGMILDVAGKISRFENVSYVACSTGDRDISVQVVARDNQELYTFVTEVIGRIPGVQKTITSLVPFIVKDDSHWRIPSSFFENQNPKP
jgi:Lrp/AsnC family transcriptional regulator for asnA, asnC and gidA